MNKRIWEVDLLRAIAILLMIVFHIVYDLNQFAGIDINYHTGFWYWEGQLAAMLFMFVAGISSGLTRSNILYAGLKLIGIGMIISVVTYAVFVDAYVRFGILHFMGTSMILSRYLKKLSTWVLFELAVVIGIVGFAFKNITINTSILLPLGLTYPGFRTVDYYPLVPYLSIFIVGMIAYKIYYYKRESLFDFQWNNRIVMFLSRHSLFIYIIHQPIIIGIIIGYQWL